MIIDKKLSVSNRRKVDIVADLRRLEFRAFPKRNSKEGDENEAVDEDGEEGESVADYDYLLGMAIWSLTKEKIAKLKEQADNKEVELKNLLEKSAQSLWNADLDEFLERWEVCVCDCVCVIMFTNHDYRKTVLSLKRNRRRERVGRK